MAGEAVAHEAVAYEALLQQVMFCTICQDERRFVGAGCVDGHGADCPERLCVECGFAVLVSEVVVERVGAGQLSRSA